MFLAREGAAAGFAGCAEGDGAVDVDVDRVWRVLLAVFVFVMDFGLAPCLLASPLVRLAGYFRRRLQCGHAGGRLCLPFGYGLSGSESSCFSIGWGYRDML